jgi:hypothetical protein
MHACMMQLQFTVYSFYAASRNILLLHKLKERRTVSYIYIQLYMLYYMLMWMQTMALLSTYTYIIHHECSMW